MRHPLTTAAAPARARSLARTARGIALAAALAPAAARADDVPLHLGEGQVVTLQFARDVSQLALGELDVVAVKASGARVEVTGLRGGHTSLAVQLEGGATVAYDVRVAGARRAASPAAADPGAIALSVGEQRRLPAAGAARLLLEDNGVARVEIERGTLVVTGTRAGTASLVVVDAAGRETRYAIRVR